MGTVIVQSNGLINAPSLARWMQRLYKEKSRKHRKIAIDCGISFFNSTVNEENVKRFLRNDVGIAFDDGNGTVTVYFGKD